MSPLNPALSQRTKKIPAVSVYHCGHSRHTNPLSGQGLAVVRRRLLTPAQSPTVCCSGVRRLVSGGSSPGHCVPNVYTRVEWQGCMMSSSPWSQGDLGKVLGLPLTHAGRLVAIVKTKWSPASKESTTILEYTFWKRG